MSDTKTTAPVHAPESAKAEKKHTHAKVGDEVLMTTVDLPPKEKDGAATRVPAGTLVSDAKLDDKTLQSLRAQGAVMPASQETADGMNRKASAKMQAERQMAYGAMVREHEAARLAFVSDIKAKHDKAFDEESTKALADLNEKQRKELETLVSGFAKDDAK